MTKPAPRVTNSELPIGNDAVKQQRIAAPGARRLMRIAGRARTARETSPVQSAGKAGLARNASKAGPAKNASKAGPAKNARRSANKGANGVAGVDNAVHPELAVAVVAKGAAAQAAIEVQTTSIAPGCIPLHFQ